MEVAIKGTIRDSKEYDLEKEEVAFKDIIWRMATESLGVNVRVVRGCNEKENLTFIIIEPACKEEVSEMNWYKLKYFSRIVAGLPVWAVRQLWDILSYWRGKR